MSGYSQAVENLAYTIDRVSSDSMDEAVLQGIVDLEVVNSMMTPDQQDEWKQIETIAHVICSTYTVEYDRLMEDVWAVLMNDVENMDDPTPTTLH